jgi:hypothetical protein
MRILAALLLLGACKKDDEVVLVQFNGDDMLVVCVGEDPDCAPVGEIDLTSTNGSTLIGTASVDPASGPVGTLHTISVDVDDTWEEDVIQVSADFIGNRGEQAWDLQRDSADHGTWEIEVESLGAEEEAREDQIFLRLYQDEAALGTTTETPTTTEE